jgi:aminoglycoside phosphotransferase
VRCRYLYSRLNNEVEKVIGDIQTIQLLAEQGCTSEVRRIITNNGSYLLKSAFKEKYRTWLREEAKVLQILHGNSIPVPNYYGFIEESNRSHLIMSFENGITLTTALSKADSIAEQKDLIRGFGQFLNHFHKIPPIETINGENDWLEEQLIKAQNYVEKGDTSGSLELLNQLRSNKPLPVKQAMIHGDCTTDNVLVINGKVQLFIDVAGMTVGDPRYDESLAIRSFRNSPQFLDAFYEGYTRYKVSEKEFQYFNEGLYEFF